MITSVSSHAFPTLAGARPSTEDSRQAEVQVSIEAGERELGQFTLHLGKLRSILEKLCRLRTEVHFRGTGRPAVVRSRSPLDLDFSAGDHSAAMASVGRLAGVTAGDFSVNGVVIAVDPATDSLEDVVARINAAGAGATASLDPAANVLAVSADEPRRSVRLSDGSSGFFSTLQVAAGDHAPPRTRSESFHDPRALKRLLQEMGEELDALFLHPFGSLDADRIGTALTALRETVAGAFGLLPGTSQGDRMDTRFGVSWDFRSTSRQLLSLDLRRLDRNLDEQFEVIHDFLFREPEGGGQQGLIPSLLHGLDALSGPLLEDLVADLAAGLVLDVEA